MPVAKEYQIDSLEKEHESSSLLNTVVVCYDIPRTTAETQKYVLSEWLDTLFHIWGRQKKKKDWLLYEKR